MSREQWGHGYHRGINDEKERQDSLSSLTFPWQQHIAEKIGFWALSKPYSIFRKITIRVWSIYYTWWYRKNS